MAALIICLPSSAQTIVSGIRYRVEVDKPFDTVLEDIEFAITEHNFRITGDNTVGEVIAKRHGEPFPRSTIIHFCNLEYARELLLIDVDYLLHMPCKIAVSQQGGRVIVETLLLPEDNPQAAALSAEINAILKAIVDYTLE